MRCSLLLLSTYLDGELNQRRGAELDAHLVGCSRCQAGLGYLRAESQRIAALAPVRVPDHSTHALLMHLGLIAPDDDLPGNRPEPPDFEDPDAPPWAGGEPGGALPWSPPERHVMGTPVMDPHPTGLASPAATLEAPRFDPQPARESEPAAQPSAVAQLEVPGVAVESRAPAAEPAAASAPPPSPEPEQFSDPVDDEPMPVRPPQKAPHTAAIPAPIRRLRDALAVRWALARSAPATLDAPSIAPAPRSPRPTPTVPARRMASPPLEPLPPVTASPVPEAQAPASAAAEWEPPPAVASPGRHLRGVASKRPASEAQPDLRLAGFGVATLLLLVVGLLVGKHVQGVPVVSRVPATHPTTAPTPHASLPPATAVATPQPSRAPTPLQLTGVLKLGTGASGYSVADLRYGSHSGDFRIVFDLTSATQTGSPAVTAGFGNPTTLYVTFSGVAPAQPPAPPTGGAVTGVSLLARAPIPGQTVYQVTLNRAATFSAIYLRSPTRLVIDVR